MILKSIKYSWIIILICMILSPANAQDKRSPDELLLEALSLTREGQYEKATLRCEEALFEVGDYPDIHQLLGKLFLIRKNYNGAKVHLTIAHMMMPQNKNVINDLITLNMVTGNYAKAEKLINVALQSEPDDQNLVLRKIEALRNQQKNEEALAVLTAQHEKNPTDEKYRYALTNLRIQMAKEAVQDDQTNKAETFLKNILKDEPNNREAYTLLMNLAYSRQQLAEAIYYSSEALAQNPNDSLFLIKKASFLAEAGRYEEAVNLALQLMTSYPSEKDSALYVSTLASQATALMKEQKWDNALTVLEKAYQVDPQNLALLKELSDVNFQLKQYQQTIAYADQALQLKPSDPFFLMKQASAWEALSQYKEAYQAAYAASQTTKDNGQYLTYADYLKSKTYKNQIGIIHLHSIYSNDRDPSWVTSLQYMRRFKKVSWIIRANYKDRNPVSGYQAESELYYQHSKKYYSYALAGWSPDTKVFPQRRLGYSLFHSFDKGWEAELGSRYVYSDGYSTFSALGSVAKYWGNNWTNIRFYAIHDDNKWNQAYTLNHRFYLNDKLDYIAIIGALGTSPDDRSRNFGTEQVSGFLLKSAGLAFQKNLNYKWTFNLVASYANQRIPNNQSYNQYDFFVTLLRNF